MTARSSYSFWAGFGDGVAAIDEPASYRVTGILTYRIGNGPLERDTFTATITALSETDALIIATRIPGFRPKRAKASATLAVHHRDAIRPIFRAPEPVRCPDCGELKIGIEGKRCRICSGRQSLVTRGFRERVA